MTAADFIRNIGNAAALPTIDDAVRQRAERLAGRLAGDGVTTRVLRRSAGKYSVEVVGDGLFEREFGSASTEAGSIIQRAIARQP